MWTIIALAICLTWAAILKAQGYPWSTVIMRPLIGLGGAHACHRLSRYRVRRVRYRAALRVNAPSRLTARPHHAKRDRRLLLRCEEGGGLFS